MMKALLLYQYSTGQLAQKYPNIYNLEGAPCKRFSTALWNPVVTWANSLSEADRPLNHADVCVPELSIAPSPLLCTARRHSGWQRSAPRS